MINYRNNKNNKNNKDKDKQQELILNKNQLHKIKIIKDKI